MASDVLKTTKYSVVGNEEKTWPQVLAIAIASLSSLTYGLMFTWTSPYMLKISDDKINYNITEAEAAYMTYIPPVAMMSSCLLFSKLNDIIGRKITLMLIAIPYITFMAMTVVATSIITFYVARLFIGLGDAFFFVSLPMYVAEISVPRVRGTWGNLVMVTLFMGTFLMNVIGSYLNVQEAAYLCLPVPLIFLVLMLSLPESPYFYVMKHQEDDAKKSLRFFRRKENVETEYKQLKADVERQISERGTWKDLFTIRSNRRALLAGIFLRVSQQLAGTMVFSNFTQLVFLKAGTNVSSQTSSIIYSGLLFFMSACSACTTEKFGRKLNYMFSLIGCSIILFLLSVYFFLDQNLKMDLSFVNWLPLVGMLLYIVVMSVGIGIVPTLMMSELYSASVKAKALTFITIVVGLTQFLTNQIFYLLYSRFGLFAPFLLFAVCCFVSTFLTLKIIPETKGKTLEEIQQVLKK